MDGDGTAALPVTMEHYRGRNYNVLGTTTSTSVITIYSSWRRGRRRARGAMACMQR